MSPGIGLKRKRDEADEDSNYLSDDSDFYGSLTTKASYQKQARGFNPSEYWSNRRPSLMENARNNTLTTTSSNPIKPYNPYEGKTCGRQLSETLPQFLARLPPQTTSQDPQTPWIYIANPFRKRPAHLTTSFQMAMENVSDLDEEEGALAKESNWAEFLRKARRILEEMMVMKHDIEKANPGKAKATITKKLNPMKQELVQKMLSLAIDLKCTSGKWMIFCETSEVNAAWSLIANGTANGELGSAAKVAPDSGADPRKPRLICIYNDDFTDMVTIKRVVAKLKEYGLVGSRGIYYKCCAYTYLHLNSDNEYGIKTSLYNSTAVLANEKNQQIQPDLLYKRKRNEEEWKAIEDANPWEF